VFEQIVSSGQSRVGPAALRAAAFAMETAGKGGDLAALRTLLPELQTQFAA